MRYVDGNGRRVCACQAATELRMRPLAGSPSAMEDRAYNVAPVVWRAVMRSTEVGSGGAPASAEIMWQQQPRKVGRCRTSGGLKGR